MSIYWQIVSESDLQLADVQKIIDEFEHFRQMPDRSAINPFTEEQMEIPGDGKAMYIAGGEPAGNFSLEEGRILFTGVPEAVVKEVAKLISATVLPWDTS